MSYDKIYSGLLNCEGIEPPYGITGTCQPICKRISRFEIYINTQFGGHETPQDGAAWTAETTTLQHRRGERYRAAKPIWPARISAAQPTVQHDRTLRMAHSDRSTQGVDDIQDEKQDTDVPWGCQRWCCSYQEEQVGHSSQIHRHTSEPALKESKTTD